MRPYSVIFTPQARKDYDNYSGKLLLRLEEMIFDLEENPRPHNSKKLVGEGSRWRIRIGDYRLLYEIDDAQKTVKIYRIAHRKEVYR